MAGWEVRLDGRSDQRAQTGRRDGIKLNAPPSAQPAVCVLAFGDRLAICENHLVVTTPAAVRARAWRAANPAAATEHLAELRRQQAGEPDRTAAVRVRRYRLRRQHRRRTDAAQLLGLPPPPAVTAAA